MALLSLCAGIASAEEKKTEFLGKPFPDFSLTDSDGNPFTLSEALKGHEAVLVNFWATWCGPCKREFPYLNEAYEKYSGRVAFIALDADPRDTPEKIGEYRKENGLAFPMGPDQDKELYHYIGGTSLPTTVVIDRFGNAAFIHRGTFKDTQEVERVLDKFLGDGYTETAVLEKIPGDASTRAFPVYAARALCPENENSRKVLFHLANLQAPIPGYIVLEETARLRIEIAADDVVANMVVAGGADDGGSVYIVKLLDPERNVFIYEQKIPGAAEEKPYVDVSLYDNTDDFNMEPECTVLLFRDEACIGKVVESLKEWGYGDVTFEFADEKAENGLQAYILHVVDQDNNPVGEVAVNFCTDASCVPQESDENGLIRFTGDPDVYHVQIIEAPDGYSWDEGFEMYTTREYGEWILRVRKD